MSQQERARVRSLTITQITVLRCFANGMTTKETADVLNMAYDTVRTHRQDIIVRMHSHSITHCVYLACKAGLV